MPNVRVEWNEPSTYFGFPMITHKACKFALWFAGFMLVGSATLDFPQHGFVPFLMQDLGLSAALAEILRINPVEMLGVMIAFALSFSMHVFSLLRGSAKGKRLKILFGWVVRLGLYLVGLAGAVIFSNMIGQAWAGTADLLQVLAFSFFAFLELSIGYEQLVGGRKPLKGFVRRFLNYVKIIRKVGAGVAEAQIDKLTSPEDRSEGEGGEDA